MVLKRSFNDWAINVVWRNTEISTYSSGVFTSNADWSLCRDACRANHYCVRYNFLSDRYFSSSYHYYCYGYNGRADTSNPGLLYGLIGGARVKCEQGKIIVTSHEHLKSQKTWLFVQQLIHVNTREKHQSSALLALCARNSVTGGFTSQRASNSDSISITWRHRGIAHRLMIPKGPSCYFITMSMMSALITHSNYFLHISVYRTTASWEGCIGFTLLVRPVVSKW